MNRCGCAVVFVAAVVLTQGAGAHTPGAKRAGASSQPPLKVGTPVAREIGPGESHTYPLRARDGDFIGATIEQRGIDVAVTLIAPDGRTVLALDAADDEFRPETLVATAESTGDYAIAVRPVGKDVPRGRYTIRLDALRPAEPADATRIEAERRFAEGRLTRDRSRASTWPTALALFTTALDAFKATGDRPGEMKTLLEIAITQYYLSKPDALETARQAEALARALGDKAATSRSLRSIGNTLVFQGDRPGAIRALEEAAAISHENGYHAGEGRSLNDLAIVCRQMGDTERAIALYRRALALTRAVNDRAFAANIVNNLGVAYKLIGEYDRALEMYAESLANARATHNTFVEIASLGNLVNLYSRAGRHAKARELGEEAVALARAGGDPVLLNHVLNNLADALDAMGQHAEALGHRRESLALAMANTDLQEQAYAFDGLGRSLRLAGDDGDAVAALDRALDLFRQIRMRFAERDALGVLAEIERDDGRLDDAARDVERSTDIDEELRAEMTSPELRGSFVASEHDRYELFIDVLERQGRLAPGTGRDAAALHVSERARARVLLESLLDGRVDLRSGLDPELLERERSAQQRLNTAAAQLSKALASGKGDQQARAAAEAVERLTAEYQRIEAEIRERSPRYANMTHPRPLEAAEIQRDVLDEHTVLLEFMVGADRSWLWALTPDTLTTIELPGRARIEPAARAVYEAFTARQRRPNESAATYSRRVERAQSLLARRSQALSQMLFGGIAGRLNRDWRGRRLAIVTSDVLDYLPFAALPEPDADTGRPRRAAARPLIASHEIVRLPSASVLAALRQEAQGRRPAPHAVAILADPVFDASDPRVAARPRPAAVHAASASASPLLADHALGQAKLPRLPFSRAEAEAVASLAGARDLLDAVDFDASRETALSARLGDYRIVHFATHGVLDTERPSLSGLVLSLLDKSGKPQNGYLRLPDIYNMRLNADLVVLSACDTALGKQIRGEGLISLTRAFMYAGAPRVVASLWQVDDVATAELMKRFYAGMLKQGLRPAAALRAAQLDISRDPRWTSPYYWAGFVVEGDWK